MTDRYSDEDGKFDEEEEFIIEEEISLDEDRPYLESEGSDQENDIDEKSYDSFLEPFWRDIVRPNDQEDKAILSLDINNGLLVAGGEDNRGYLMHPNDHINSIISVEEFKDSVIFVKFSPDGNLVAMASLDGQLKLLNRKGELVYTFEIGSDINWMEGHPKGKAMAVGVSDSSTWVLNMTNYTCLYVIPAFSTNNQCGSFTIDGSRLIIASNGIIVIVDIRSGERIMTYKLDSLANDEFTFVQVHPTLNLTALGTDSGKIVILSTLNQQVIKILNAHKDSIESLIFTSKNLYSCSMDGKVNVWDVNLFELRSTLVHKATDDNVDNENNSDHENKKKKKRQLGISQMLLIPNKFLVTTGTDGCIKIWNPSSCNIIKEYHYHKDTPCMSLVKSGEGMNDLLFWASFNDGVILSFKA